MTLSRKDTLILKGFAIICIVLHNVLHLLTSFKENEFSFHAENIKLFLKDFSVFPVVDMLSFFGWLGVSVFVFISGYGLQASYGSQKIKPSHWIRCHYIKLLLLLTIPLLIYTILFFIIEGFNPMMALVSLMEELLILNFISPQSFNPGVYWYLGLAMQLYLVFLILRCLSDRVLVIAVMVACLIISFTSGDIQSYIRHNFIGWIPEFIFGMFYCRNRTYLPDDYRWSSVIAIACLPLIFLVSLTTYTFYLAGPLFIVFILGIKKFLSFIPGLAWIGSISASLYVIHPIVRYLIMCLPIELIAFRTSLIVLAISLLLAIPYQYFLNMLNRTILHPQYR